MPQMFKQRSLLRDSLLGWISNVTAQKKRANLIATFNQPNMQVRQLMPA